MVYDWENPGAERLRAPRIAIGEAVFARCGGPCMIVVVARPDGWAEVQWFVGGIVQHEAFPCSGLRRANWFDRLCAAFGG